MSNWNCELFKQDVTKMNYMELADWITACRSVVLKENFDTYEKYITHVDMFCKEWEAFYEHNQKFFTDNIHLFKKALVFSHYKKNISYEFDYGSKTSQSFEEYQNSQQIQLVSRDLKEIDQDYSGVYKLVEAVFTTEDGYKKRLHDVVLDQTFRFTKIKVRAFDNGAWVKAVSYDEFIEKCEKQKYHFELIPQHRKNSYTAVFKEYDVTPSVYSDFISENGCEQEFGKKFFINLGFAMSLNLTLVEKLLNYNGYTIKNKSRQFDVICEKAFRIGFGREYTIALIDKYNAEKSKEYDVYKPMPNIRKEERRKKTGGVK